MRIQLGEFSVSEPRLTTILGGGQLVRDMEPSLERERSCGPAADYGGWWSDWGRWGTPYKQGDIRLRILSQLADRPLIDLCSGESLRPFFGAARDRGRISSYLGIDGDIGIVPATKTAKTSFGRVAILDKELLKVSGGILEGDVLVALSAVDRMEANVAINGIDASVASSSQADYWEEVVNQVDRLVPVGGHVIGFTLAYGLLDRIAGRDNFETEVYDQQGIKEPELGAGFYSIQKVS